MMHSRKPSVVSRGALPSPFSRRATRRQAVYFQVFTPCEGLAAVCFGATQLASIDFHSLPVALTRRGPKDRRDPPAIWYLGARPDPPDRDRRLADNAPRLGTRRAPLRTHPEAQAGRSSREGFLGRDRL